MTSHSTLDLRVARVQSVRLHTRHCITILLALDELSTRNREGETGFHQPR